MACPLTHLFLLTTFTIVTRSDEGVESFNFVSQDGHDSPTLVEQQTKVEKPAAPKCTDLQSEASKSGQSSGLHSNSVEGWAIFLYVCLALVIVAIAAAILYKLFRDNSPNIFEKIYPGIQVQEANKPINSGRNTIIQV